MKLRAGGLGTIGHLTLKMWSIKSVLIATLKFVLQTRVCAEQRLVI